MGNPQQPKPIAAQLSEDSGSPAALQALVSCRSHSPVCQLSIQFYLCSITTTVASRRCHSRVKTLQKHNKTLSFKVHSEKLVMSLLETYLKFIVIYSFNSCVNQFLKNKSLICGFQSKSASEFFAMNHDGYSSPG